MTDTVFDRDRMIRSADLTCMQTFYLTTLNQFVGRNADAWPSQTTLANAMNAGLRSVRNWQQELEGMGVLQVDIGKGRSQTNRYRLDLSKLPVSDTLNEEPRAAYTELNAAPRAGVMRHHVPVNAAPRADRKNKKEQLKEQGEFPAELSGSESFKIAWQEWTKHRCEIRKALTPTTTARQLKKLATWGPTKAVQSIGQSIEHGWAGLFDPDGKRNGTAIDPGFLDARSTIYRVYLPDLRNIADVQQSLTADQYAAADAVGIDRIARSRPDDRTLAAEFASARKASK